MNKLISFMSLAVIPTAVWADHHEPEFSDKPIWVSGSKSCGGDGNARLLDLDQDGDLDVVTSAPNPSHWVVFENNGGKLAEKPMWESKPTTDCDHISVLDFNKDGMTDLAGTHESHNTLYLNDKSREQRCDTVPDWETGFYTDSNQIDVGDVDGDGDLDMAAADWSGRSTSVFLQADGMIAAKPVWTAANRAPVHEAVFGDIDGDGDLDVVAGGLDQAMLFENFSK